MEKVDINKFEFFKYDVEIKMYYGGNKFPSYALMYCGDDGFYTFVYQQSLMSIAYTNTSQDYTLEDEMDIIKMKIRDMIKDNPDIELKEIIERLPDMINYIFEPFEE